MDPNSTTFIKTLCDKDPYFITAVSSFIAPIFPSLLGAIVGGFIAAWATRKSVQQIFQNDLKKRNMEKQENLQGLYKAIKSELKALWTRYNEGAGKDIENLEDGKPLLMYYPLTQDYFTVYQSNAHLIGEIQNEDLRGLVILTYAAAKGVVDSYRYNNHIVGQHEHWDWIAAETKNPLHVNRAKAFLNSCVEYATDLKKSHYEIKELLQRLNTAIDNELLK